MMLKALPKVHFLSALFLKQQMIIYRFLVKFAQKIPTKLAVFYWLLSSEVSPENFLESVFENPAKFDFFCDLSEAL